MADGTGADGTGGAMKLFCFGMGYSARATLAPMKPNLARAWGTTRSEDKKAAIEALGAEPVVWAGEKPDAELGVALSEATHILVSAAPGSDGDPVLNACSGLLAKARP